MDRKMLRFVEKRGIRTDGEPSGAAVAAVREPGLHGVNRWTVKC